jgi:hypothetical protein
MKTKLQVLALALIAGGTIFAQGNGEPYGGLQAAVQLKRQEVVAPSKIAKPPLSTTIAAWIGVIVRL